jgi:hypothetical protein
MVGRAPTRARSLPGSCLFEVFSQSHGMATHQRRSRPNAKGRGSAATAFISPLGSGPRVKSGPRGATRPHAGLAAARHLTRAGGLPRHSRSLPTAPNHPRTAAQPVCLLVARTAAQPVCLLVARTAAQPVCLLVARTANPIPAQVWATPRADASSREGPRSRLIREGHVCRAVQSHASRTGLRSLFVLTFSFKPSNLPLERRSTASTRESAVGHWLWTGFDHCVLGYPSWDSH